MAEAATKSWNRCVLHLDLGLLVVTLGAIEDRGTSERSTQPMPSRTLV